MGEKGTPGELARQLGIRPSATVLALEPPPDVQAVLRAACQGGVTLLVDEATIRTGLVFARPRTLDGLAERFTQLQWRIQPDGALWVVMPKKPFAAARGITFTWEQMRATVLTTDLVDNRVVAFSPQEYATRFVLRKERRAAYLTPPALSPTKRGGDTSEKRGL